VLETLQRACDRALSLSQTITWLPPLLARVSVGLVFATTGWGKLHHLDRVIEFFRSLGIPHPELQAPFVGSTELVCGCLLVLGLGTRLVVFPLLGTMVVAIATAIWPELDGAIDLLGKEEFLFIVLLLWLAVNGGGAVSLDAVLGRALRPGRARVPA
jgi:putative oxidoreductase